MDTYSYMDARELAPELDDTREDIGPTDAHGFDVDDYTHAVSHDSLSDYLVSLFTEVDTRAVASSKWASAPARSVSALALSIAVDAAREMRHAQFARAVNQWDARVHMSLTQPLARAD